MTVAPKDAEVGGCWPLVIGYDYGFRSVCGCAWVSLPYAEEAAAMRAAHLVGRVEDGHGVHPWVHGLNARRES